MGNKSGKRVQKKYFVLTGGILLVALMISLALIAGGRKKDKNEQNSVEMQAMDQLSIDDKTIAETYAALYGESAEQVAKMKLESDDWDQVYARLEEAYFSIGETKKYQMAEDGYSMEDLEAAETLARQTGKNALDLALAKGRAGDHRNWTDILDTDTAESVEEKLGLTKQQVKTLKENDYSLEDRIEIALLCFNRNESFESVMEELESGKDIEELKEENTDE